MSNLDAIKSLLPDNTTREISEKDLRDSFGLAYSDIDEKLTSDKANLLYLALSEYVNNGKIRADKIEALALSELIVAVETSIAEFMANNFAYEYQKNDFIAIPDVPGNYSLFMFAGGNKTVLNNYIHLGLSRVTIPMVDGLQNALDTKLSAPYNIGNFFLQNTASGTTYSEIIPEVNYLLYWKEGNFNESNVYYDGAKLGVGTIEPTEMLHLFNGRLRTKAITFDNNPEAIPGQITYSDRRFKGTDITGQARNFMYADFSDFKYLWIGFTDPEKEEIKSLLGIGNTVLSYNDDFNI